MPIIILDFIFLTLDQCQRLDHPAHGRLPELRRSRDPPTPESASPVSRNPIFCSRTCKINLCGDETRNEGRCSFTPTIACWPVARLLPALEALMGFIHLTVQLGDANARPKAYLQFIAVQRRVR